MLSANFFTLLYAMDEILELELSEYFSEIFGINQRFTSIKPSVTMQVYHFINVLRSETPLILSTGLLENHFCMEKGLSSYCPFDESPSDSDMDINDENYDSVDYQPGYPDTLINLYNQTYDVFAVERISIEKLL
jgi:hypothetical protein